MGIFSRFFGAKAVPPSATPPTPGYGEQHAVIVYFGEFPTAFLDTIWEIEDELTAAIDAAGAGEFDGYETAVDGSEGSLYMYGPDADRLFEVVRPTLERIEFMRGARVLLRYGPPEGDVPERTVMLGA